MNFDDMCVCCGEYVPEGSMVCPFCLRMAEMSTKEKKEELHSFLKEQHRGKENAVFSSELERIFQMGDRDVRRCVSSLRKEGVPICSDFHKGYFYADGQEDVNDTVGSLNGFLTGIANARTGLLYARVMPEMKIKSIRFVITPDEGPEEEFVLVKKE